MALGCPLELAEEGLRKGHAGMWAAAQQRKMILNTQTLSFVAVGN